MPGIARVTVEDIEVHFEGDHPHTVVMLHGWPDTSRLRDATVEALKDRYCCVRFTLPGFDIQADPRATSLDDMCEWLLTVVDQVSPGLPVTLLLHDWGCIFGYEFAARHPARVARIVAVIIITITGLTLAFGETSGGFRKLIQIVFGLSIAFAATSFFLTFFSFGGGALI